MHKPLLAAMGRLEAMYGLLALTQAVVIVLYERGLLQPRVGLTLGLATSLLGPGLSLRLSLRVMRRPRRSRWGEVTWISVTYGVTIVSFAMLHTMMFYRDLHAYGLPAGAPQLFFGDALYFSITTITTTGYGDIVPLSALARTIACAEMAVGLMYQITVFSLLAAVIGAGAPPDKEVEQSHITPASTSKSPGIG